VDFDLNNMTKIYSLLQCRTLIQSDTNPIRSTPKHEAKHRKHYIIEILIYFRSYFLGTIINHFDTGTVLHNGFESRYMFGNTLSPILCLRVYIMFTGREVIVNIVAWYKIQNILCVP
jgi:hypothetical protein